MFTGQQHDIFHEHADIRILADLHLAVQHKEQPDRRIEETIVTGELFELAGRVRTRHADQVIKLLPDDAAAGPVGLDQIRWIDIILRLLGDAGFHLLLNIADEGLQRLAGDRMNGPGLQIAARWCAFGDFQQLAEGLQRNRCVHKLPHGHACLDGVGNFHD